MALKPLIAGMSQTSAGGVASVNGESGDVTVNLTKVLNESEISPLSGTFQFHGEASGDVTSMTFQQGVLVNYSTVP